MIILPMKHPDEILASYFTNTTIIIVLILILMTGIAGASTVTYRWIPSNGAAVATGINTNWGTCGAQPSAFVTTLITNASTSGCTTDRHQSGTLDPATDMVFNTAYAVDTTVTGISYFGRLRDSGSGGGTFTFKLIYVFPNGTKVVLPGTAGSQSITSGSSADYTVSLSGMSGVVPSGAKPGIRISKSGSSTSLRLYVGDTANNAGTGPSGYFSIDEVAVPRSYSITGLVNDISGNPIALATVTTNKTLSATTDETGWYTLTGVLNATYLITATKAGFSSNTTTVTVNGNNVTANTIILQAGTDVIYRWTPDTGTTVATGITTNWGACGAQPSAFVTTLLTTASTSGCNADRHGSSALDPSTDMVFNTPYVVDTTVTGISYFGRLRDSSSGGGTFTFKLIYVFPNGTKVVLPGTAGSQSIISGTSADYTVSLSGMSGVVPSGAKPGLRVSKSGSSTSLRLYVGDTANNAGTGPSGYFSVYEVAVQLYSISGLVKDISGNPIASATVNTNTSLSTTTNATGYYTFTGMQNANYLITASRSTYYDNTTTVAVNGANVSANTIILNSAPVYQITGLVTDNVGAALADATVTTNTSQNTITNETGYYTFTGMENSTYLITASASSYIDNSMIVTVNGNDLTANTIILQASTDVIYRFLPSTGETIATGLTTNYGTCGDNPTTSTIALLTRSTTSGCDASSATGTVTTPASTIDMYSNTAYSRNTNVSGNWYFGRIRNTGGSATVHTYRLIYAYPNGSVVVLPGSGSVSATVSDKYYNVSMANINGTVPAGAKLGLRISKASTATSRVSWFGDTGGSGSVASGYLSVNEVSFAGGYNITGFVTDNYGTPIDSAIITTNTSQSTTTDEFGYYTLEGMENSTYLITASDNSYIDNSTIVTVNGNDVTANTIMLDEAELTSSVIYFLENNATSNNLGADGTTDFSTSGTTITAIPYKQMMKNAVLPSVNIRYTTASTSTEYNVFNFYMPANYSTNATIVADTKGNISWRGTSTTNRVNVTLWDYDFSSGAKTRIGNTVITTTGGTNTRTYPYTITHLPYNISMNHRLMLTINTTTPTTGTVRLYFGTVSNLIVKSILPDITPPTAPTNLNSYPVFSNIISLIWNASTDPDDPVAYYTIEKTNESFLFGTGRTAINATNFATGYESDAYWFSMKNNAPVNCDNCHTGAKSGRDNWTANFWIKYDSTYLYLAAHMPDNDTGSGDDSISIVFDVNKNGGTAPQTDDLYYELYEDNRTEFKKGNGTGWVLQDPANSSFTHTVKGSSTYGPRYELMIPLAEIGNPVNGSTIRWMLENECTNGMDFLTRDVYFPKTGENGNPTKEDDPSTWSTITFRNGYAYDTIGTTTLAETTYTANNLIGQYRYNFTVKATDSNGNTGPRSNYYNITTSHDPGYAVSGYVKTPSGIILSDVVVFTGHYSVLTDSSGKFTLELGNGTYDIQAVKNEIYSDTISITVAGADITNADLTLSLLMPAINSWGNTWTNNNDLSISINADEIANFYVTASQTVNYTWEYDGVDQFNDLDTFTYEFTELGTHYITATVTNGNGTDNKNWTVLVEPETIDVTLSNFPIYFGNVSSDGSAYPSLSPLIVIIQGTTNVNVNLTISGSDFIYGEYGFGVGNLSYSNSPGGSRTNMATSFPLPPYENWISITKKVNQERSIYFWLSIPAGQESGIYESNINVMVEKYI